MGRNQGKKKKHRVNRSIKAKAFFITLIITIGIGGTVLFVGSSLFLDTVYHENYINMWNLANAELVVLEDTEVKAKCEELMAIYETIPEDERGYELSDENYAKFEPAMDDTFLYLKKRMTDLRERNGPLNAYIIAVDKDCERMVYLIDSDPRPESFVPPGESDPYTHKDLTALVKGREVTELGKRIGMTEGVQAAVTDLPKYGLRCTGASTLYETDDYTVLVCAEENMEKLMNMSRTFLLNFILLLIGITLLASFIAMAIIRRGLVKPITQLADAAKAYGDDRSFLSGDEKAVKHFDRLDINTGDEIENLAQTMKDMEDDIAASIDNLTTVTAERERISTELTLAARIQESMLPRNFPAFPERSEFDVYASMEPAKEVGGDFYDFFLIDEDHLYLAIADVAGKGIPAALFMMASKILLAGKAREGISPSKILADTNERICGNNVEEMFVTVWLGILEISTGHMIAANAGHEYPIIIHEDGQAEIIKDEHGFVVGGMEGMKYKDYELQLKPGEKLFLYTDGVTEATSKTDGMFGMERLLDAASSDGSDPDPKQTIMQVHAAVDEFVGEEEQFDDLTMMCFSYFGENGDE